MKPDIQKKYNDFMKTLGCCDQPLVAYYSDKKPVNHTGPNGGFFIEIKKFADLLSLVSKAKISPRCLIIIILAARDAGFILGL